MNRAIRITGMGVYLPERRVTAEEIDERIGEKIGWVRQHVGIVERRHELELTVSEMGARAVTAALADAALTLEDVDALVYAGACVDQLIPATATLIKAQLDQPHLRFPAWDVNVTCLSFMMALDMMSTLIEAGQYRTVVLVTSEKASVGMNYAEKESSSLFGDAAVAFVLQRSNGTSVVGASHFETFSEGVHWCEVRGGGSTLPARPETVREDNRADFLFAMDGRKVFKKAFQEMPRFMDAYFNKAKLSWSMIDFVIPHQASPSAMALMQKRLGVADSQMISIVSHYGNTIAASMPLAFYLGVTEGRIRRGDCVVWIGTSAGLTIGAMSIVY
ncbi:MAG: 3-oxoacyl-[acyl-carrier-protein] synthase III C-terminal domain-containing protein [Bacilli bacterium]